MERRQLETPRSRPLPPASGEPEDRRAARPASQPASRPPAALVAGISRTAGNRAAASLAGAPIRRLIDGMEPVLPSASPADLVAQAERTLDVGDIKAVPDLALVSTEKRIPMIRALASQGWVGPRDEAAIERLWGLFGDGVLTVASANLELWKKSIETGAELLKLPAVKGLPGKFLGDVRAMAAGFLDGNERYARSELEVLQAAGSEGAAGAAAATRTHEIQEAAKIVVKAREAEVQLGKLVVGYETHVSVDEFGVGDRYEVPVTFKPNSPPPRSTSEEGAGNAPKDFAEVQGQWETLQLLVQAAQTKYPALFAVDRGGADATKKAAEGSPDDTRSQVTVALTKLIDNIATTRGRLDGNLLWELAPIHQQLLGGAKGSWGIDWKDPVKTSIVKAAIDDHESTEFWISLGLASAAAAAFVVASIATGGAAAVAFGAGLGIGAGQAAASWDKVYELKAASGSSIGPRGMLVNPEQVDLAVLTAVLDTVFVFVDGAGIGKVIGTAAGKGAVAGAERAVIKGLEELAGKSAAEATPLVERAVLELGVEETARRTSMTSEQLLKLLGEDSASEAAKRLRAFAALPAEITKLTNDQLVKRIGGLAAEIETKREVGEQLARAGLERFGPAGLLEKSGGWKKLSLALGNESPTGALVKQWRDSMETDIKEFVKRLPGGANKAGEAQVKRTGTIGKFTNDFDISLLGANSSANRNAVREFMAARTGISSDRLGEMLLADFFTDPNRLHIYDMLKPELRSEIAQSTEKTAESLILNKTLADAEKAGNKQVVEQITQIMKDQGVQKVSPHLLGEADRAALYIQQDALHAELEAAIKAGDEAAQKRLAKRIGQIGGQINVAEGGGYFSGGGVAKLVTEKEGLQAGAKTLLTPQKYTALLDQLPKLYGDANALLKTGFVATEDAVSAIKGVAKYADRFRSIMAEMGVAGGDPAVWKTIATDCEKLLKQAKGEADVTLLSRLTQDAAKVERQVNTLLEQFAGQSAEVLKQVSAQAGLAAEADLVKVQYLTLANAKYLRAADTLRETMHNFVIGLDRTVLHSPPPEPSR